MFNKSISIGEYTISENDPVFIIGEAGVNHNGDIEQAKAMIDAAVKCGVNAVKFQSFRSEELILENVPKAEYQRRTTTALESQLSMLKKLELSELQSQELQGYCASMRNMFLTTPFDEFSLDTLDPLDLPAYKISSTDITNLPFIRKIARKAKPIIISTGMANMYEIEMALAEIEPIQKDVILLQCTSDYPIQETEVNLNVLKTYQKTFGILTGFSDHTLGTGASPYAVALGAKVIEKHFTDNRGRSGPDHKFAIEPSEWSEMVKETRRLESSLGNYIKKIEFNEKETVVLQRRSIRAKNIIRKGHVIKKNDLVFLRPSPNGAMDPFEYKKIINKVAIKDIPKEECLIIKKNIK